MKHEHFSLVPLNFKASDQLGCEKSFRTHLISARFNCFELGALVIDYQSTSSCCPNHHPSKVLIRLYVYDTIDSCDVYMSKLTVLRK